MTPPPDDRWYVKLGRFLNVLDAEINVLSPVKIQAWVATITAAATQVTGFLHSHYDMIASGTSMVWATLAHAAHLMDKRQQAQARGDH